MTRVFLDANVILDALLQRERSDVANQVLILFDHPDFKGFTSVIVVHIVTHFLMQTYSVEETRTKMLGILHIIQPLQTSQSALQAALRSGIDDLEDAYQYFTALEHAADYVISRDKAFAKATRHQPIPVLTPQQFLAQYV